MRTNRWRSSYYVNNEIDVFENKEEILEALSDKELEDELKRRKEENRSVTKIKRQYLVDVEIDISDYYEEALEFAGDDSLMSELESRGFNVYDKEEINYFTGELKDLARFVGLRPWSTKEQVMNEINYYINSGK